MGSQEQKAGTEPYTWDPYGARGRSWPWGMQYADAVLRAICVLPRNTKQGDKMKVCRELEVKVELSFTHRLMWQKPKIKSLPSFKEAWPFSSERIVGHFIWGSSSFSFPRYVLLHEITKQVLSQREKAIMIP